MIMTNTLREKLDAGKPTIGTHYLSSDPICPKSSATPGCTTTVNTAPSTSAFDMQLLYHMARAGQCGNLPLMLKPDQRSQAFWAQAAIGAGFKAVLFTDVRTVEDVQLCHQAIRADMPGVGGHMGVKLRRPALTSYNPDGYVNDLQSVVFLIMIEKDVAVRDLDAILQEARDKGVDMNQWGPADFGFSRGNPSLMFTPEIQPFEELVIKKSIEYGVPPRIEIADVEQAKRYVQLGVRHFCIGWDRFIYQAALMKTGEGLRKIVETL